MNKCSVYCIETKKDVTADILEQSDKRIKVVFTGTNMTLVLQRQHLRQPYVGHEAGMEFETFGELEDELNSGSGSS